MFYVKHQFSIAYMYGFIISRKTKCNEMLHTHHYSSFCFILRIPETHPNQILIFKVTENLESDRTIVGSDSKKSFFHDRGSFQEGKGLLEHAQ